VHGADANRETTGGGHLHQVLPDLLHQFLLNLEPGGEVVYDPIVF
jgi:hypothetical protein